MDWSPLADALLSPAPLLPDMALLRAARRVSWALVLACLLLYLGGARWPLRVRWGLSLGLLGVMFLPGPLSLAYWLGLAFQTPSVMSSVLAMQYLACLLRGQPCVPLTHSSSRALAVLSWVGIALGWLLLLDLLAVLPFPGSLYAWGFSPAVLATVAVLSALPWVMGGTRHGGAWVSGLLGAVLLLYAALRLPNGNLWNALLDPWLWIVLQLGWLLRGARWFKARHAPTAATRA